MAEAWRIVKARLAAEAFTGEGARRFGGRWNARGLALVYASEHLATAVLEMLVHMRPVIPREKLLLFRVRMSDALIERLPAKSLPAGWRLYPPSAITTGIGDRWAREARTAVLAVPSAIVPEETNFLLNPEHRDFRKIRVSAPEPFFFDERLSGI